MKWHEYWGHAEHSQRFNVQQSYFRADSAMQRIVQKQKSTNSWQFVLSRF